jgi:ketosteroid isomerase-like protein
MKLDDLARRAAAEVGEASRRARFTVRPPGSRRWRLPAVVVAATAVVALGVGVPLLLLKGPWATTVLEPGLTTTSVATTTAATTTTEAMTTTTLAAGKTPMATVDELVAAVHAAVNAKDGDAVWALTADDAFHPVYYVGGRTGHISDNLTPDYDWSSDPLQGIEVLGESLVSGDVVVTPVRATYPEPTGVLTGFDVLVVRRVEGGLLIGGAATFFADDWPDLVADPAEAQALIEASAAAFNADDVEGMLALMTEDGAIWADMTDIDTLYRGAALQEFLAADLGFTVGFTGEPVASGRFFAVPSRNTDTATGFTYDGMYIYWIVDGKIALQAYAQGR